MSINKIIKQIKLKKYLKRGLSVGDNFQMENRVHIDPGFPWLVEIGDNVTLAPEVVILAHDACMKMKTGFASVARVKIGNNVFVGAKSIILQGVTIGDNVIIGAGSVVTKDIPSGSVACGNPAKVIKNIDDFVSDKNREYENGPIIECSDVIEARRNPERRKNAKDLIGDKKAFIRRIEK